MFDDATDDARDVRSPGISLGDALAGLAAMFGYVAAGWVALTVLAWNAYGAFLLVRWLV